MSEVYEYEVRCPRCDVSFPTGTKTCLHCGGRTGPSRGRSGWRRNASEDVHTGLPGADENARLRGMFVRPDPFDVERDDEEVESRRGGFLRAAITLVWIAIAVAFSILRACSEQ